MVWPLVLYWKIWKSDMKKKQKKLEEYGLLTDKEFWSSSLTLQQKDQIFQGCIRELRLEDKSLPWILESIVN